MYKKIKEQIKKIEKEVYNAYNIKFEQDLKEVEGEVIQTKTGMKLQIIPKQDVAPISDSNFNVIKLRHITTQNIELEAGEITQEVITDILRQIPFGIEAYLSLDSYGEDDWLEIICNKEWLALAYSTNGGQENYYSYNPDYAGIEDWSPLNSGGQSPIEKYLALTDIKAGIQAVEYFIQTGKLYSGISWAKQMN